MPSVVPDRKYFREAQKRAAKHGFVFDHKMGSGHLLWKHKTDFSLAFKTAGTPQNVGDELTYLEQEARRVLREAESTPQANGAIEVDPRDYDLNRIEPQLRGEISKRRTALFLDWLLERWGAQDDHIFEVEGNPSKLFEEFFKGHKQTVPIGWSNEVNRAIRNDKRFRVLTNPLGRRQGKYLVSTKPIYDWHVTSMEQANLAGAIEAGTPVEATNTQPEVEDIPRLAPMPAEPEKPSVYEQAVQQIRGIVAGDLINQLAEKDATINVLNDEIARLKKIEDRWNTVSSLLKDEI